MSLKHPPGIHVELIDMHKGKRKSEPFQIDSKKSAPQQIARNLLQQTPIHKKHNWEPSLVYVWQLPGHRGEIGKASSVKRGAWQHISGVMHHIFPEPAS